ncbi:very-long-chain 3-oxoacyl-CoA reductase 1-like [Lolium perenne]|uniref:very-long-chain 3-oxoacyl-CoA reductase 1-like n=1 Tax=Lolium perenne TaxID=4522 RepID=UPI0021EA2705
MPAAVPVWFISLAALGALYLSAACIPLLAHLAHLALCLRRPIDLRRRYGTWAVITGPTTGLGKATAMELASRGISLVLLDLDAANLQSVSESIARTHPSIQTKTVVFDLSLVGTAAGDQSIQELREAVEGLDVGVLVNNAAVARPGVLYVHEADMERLARMIRVNVTGLTEVTAAVLPGILQRGRGAIVNVGSGSTVAVPSFPLYTVYSATKRWVPICIRENSFLDPLTFY